jgi:hypothetical protein
MVYGAIDLHMRYSQIRIVDAEGAVLHEQRVPTSAARLVEVFGGRGAMRILLETGTESEWVAQALEAVGHEVVVADPNYAPMYGEIRRKVKTDRRDVAALAEANRRGWYRATHRVSRAQRGLRQILRSRRQLVQMRSGTISLIRSLLRQEGYRLVPGSSERVPARLAVLELPSELRETIAPLARMVETLTTEIAAMRGWRRWRRRTRSSHGSRVCPGSARWWRSRSGPLSTMWGGLPTPGRSAPRLAWSPAKTVRRSAATAGTLPKRARASCAACWSKRPGRVGAVRRAGRCARGWSASPAVGANALRWWPWRVV